MIQLPDFFTETLAKSPTLAAAVQNTFHAFEPWFANSGMPFFAGYTDHGPQHINDVLQAAASLISDSSRPLISAPDILIMSGAIVLHDCAHHLTPDGFRALIEKPARPLIAGLGDLPWSQLWNDFLSEASRFGEEKLNAIFGNAEPCRTDLLDLRNLTQRDCLLIGEFLRRHHARLAHEIAIAGVPGPGKDPLRLMGFDDDLADIAGLIARSHGMPLRATFE